MRHLSSSSGPQRYPEAFHPISWTQAFPNPAAVAAGLVRPGFPQPALQLRPGFPQPGMIRPAGGGCPKKCHLAQLVEDGYGYLNKEWILLRSLDIIYVDIMILGVRFSSILEFDGLYRSISPSYSFRRW